MFTSDGERIDSFFAFGQFRAAPRSRFFPPELVGTFEPEIQEAPRHRLFFANRVASYRKTMAWWRRPWHSVRLAIGYRLVWQRLPIARRIDADGGTHDANFPRPRTAT